MKDPHARNLWHLTTTPPTVLRALMSDHGLQTIGKLCQKSATDLAQLGITPYDIRRIQVDLSWHGLALQGSHV